MAYTVREITDHAVWNAFTKTAPFQVFPQSVPYTDFYHALGEQVSILGVYFEEKLVSGSVVVSTHAKRGNFLYLPYGPVIHDLQQEEGILKALIIYLREFARAHRYHFIRCSPFLDHTPERQLLWKKLGFTPAPIHVLAEDTWILNLFNTNDEILAKMNKNHRNLIHRLEREKVTVTMSTDVKDLEDLHTLLDITAKRHHFHRFSRSYINAEFSAFAGLGQAVLFRAYLPDGRLDAAAIIIYHGNMAAYRHSGSLGLDSRLPTSYLLQWQAIMEAKKRGMEWYNFWGIAPDGAKKQHPFFGITHFKKGFGGESKHLLPCQDLQISPFYYVTKFIETIRSIKRGF